MLKGDEESAKFTQAFEAEVQKNLKEKADNYGKLTAEIEDPNLYLGTNVYQQPKHFSVEGDDKLKSGHWGQLFKDCAYYFDRPNTEAMREIKAKLQRDHDSLFEEGWRPPLDS